MIRPIALASLILVTTLSNVTSAEDHEKKIKLSQLPAAVQKTVTEQSKGAEVRGFTTEREGGKTYYEAEMRVNGHSKDVLMDADGKVIEVEEEVFLKDLSPAVKRGLVVQAGAGNITMIESITKNDKLVAYEAKVSNHGKRSEIQVGPNGQPLEHEE
jgi:hypothetical protein